MRNVLLSRRSFINLYTFYAFDEIHQFFITIISWIEILAADYYKVIAATRTEVDILIDGNIAIVSSRWQGNGIFKDEPFNDNQRCGLVIQKKGKELKLLSEHCVDISTEPSF